MANTIISIRSSGVLGNTPSTLQPGELAINYADGKLYYGDSSSTVNLYDAGSGFEPAGLNGEIQFNDFGLFGSSGSFSYDNANNVLIVPNILVGTINVSPSIVFASTTANTANQRAVTSGTYANAAFGVANTASVNAASASSYANSAYTQANTATTNAATSDQRAVTSGLYANAAYTQANTANINATSAGSYANGAFNTANTANSYFYGVNATQNTNITTATTNAATADQRAVTSGLYANAAFSVANTASVNALSAGSYANSAYTQANTATTNAATADQRAVTSGLYANSAYTQANTATTNSASAGSYANSAYTQANTATTNAATADQRAVTSGSYANSAFGVANTASVNATSAGSYANGAFGVANTANQRAVTSGVYANSAYTQANTATTNAATADQRAVTSGVYANAAFATANTKYNSSGGTISGDVNITGNLNVVGATITHSANSFVINDPLILLANNNPGNLLDTGFVSHYVEGGVTKHTGLVRDSSANTFYLFDNYVPHIQETNILDVNDASLRITTLRSNLVSDLVLVRGYDVVNHTNNAYTQANTATTNAATADQRAVTSGSYANSAFGVANTASSNSISASSYANGAFTRANTANTNAATANQRAVTSGAYANSAYLHANASFTLANSKFNTSGGTITGNTVISANSTTDALRITQVGTGNALLVEDSANPDSTPTVIDSTGKLGIGINTPTANLHINNSTATGNVFLIDALGGESPNFVMRGDGEQTFRFHNTALEGSTRVSWKMADRIDPDWRWIMYTDVAANGEESFELRNKTSGAMIHATSTNIGIGTNTPSAKLNVVANTSTDAVRITQLGTGNALVVEDAANPDSTPFVVDQNGRIIVGDFTARNTFSVTGKIQIVTSSIFDGGLAQYMYSADSNPQINTFNKSRGATLGTQTIVQSGDNLGDFRFAGSDGTNFIEAARIVSQVDGTPGTNDMPGRLVFSTTADGASSPTERMRIDNQGRVGIGVSPTSELTVRDVVDGLSIVGAFENISNVSANTAAAINITADQATSRLTSFRDGAGTGSSLALSTSLVGVVTERMRITNTGTISLGAAPGSESLRVTPVASAVNFLNVSGAATGGGVLINANGSDANIPLFFAAKGTGQHFFSSNSGTQFNIGNTASAVNYLRVNGSAGTTPTLSAQGSGADLDIALTPKGTGSVTTASPVVISANSTADALRITQVGTGNALVVEDSANPDSTPFVIDNAGNTLIGTNNSFAVVTTSKLQISGSTDIHAQFARFSNDTGGSSLTFGKSRGTSNTSRGIVSSGDAIGNIYWAADDGVVWRRAAQIEAFVDGTPGAGDMPGRLVFATTADGASAPTERMRIDNAGRVGIGSTSLAGYRVRVGGVFETTGTAGLAVAAETTIPSNVTGNAYGFYSAINTAASAFTLGILHHYRAAGQTLGAGSTVTNQYGFHADSGLTGATNNYGFFSDIASGTGRWNFYAAGSAANYFAGNVGVGVTPAKTVDVNGQLRVRNGGATGYGLLEYGASATATNNWHAGSEGDGTFRWYNGIFGAGLERGRISSAGVWSLGAAPGAESLRVTPVASAVNTWNFFGATTGNNVFQIPNGTDTNINVGYGTKGSGYHSFFTNSNAPTIQFLVSHTTSAVNYLQVTGGPTVFGPEISAQGAGTNLDLYLKTKGTGSYVFYTNSAVRQFQIAHTASAVNYLQATGAATGNRTVFSAQGSDTNVGINYNAKGAEYHVFTTSGGVAQFVIQPTASAVNHMYLTGGTTGNAPAFSAQGSDTNIGITLTPKGTGGVAIGATSAGGYKLYVNGSFAATTKSFVIDHPTKPGKKLRYGSLEGPENGVYVRGKTQTNVIELPEYWTKLVDPDSITVQLTPIGKHQKLYVEKIKDNKVYIVNEDEANTSINCFYYILAERVDVEKLEVEIG
jgi:hypothetical protein